MNNKRDLKKLELGWSSNKVGIESKRYQKMSEDIKLFTSKQFISLPYPNASKTQTHDIAYENSKKKDSPFNLISSTFGFSHHPGTDQKAELKTLKLILKRENLITFIRSYADKFLEAEKLDGVKIVLLPSSTDVLEVLTQIRDITLELIESVCMWRLTAPFIEQNEIPKPFIWQNRSYLLKLINDLDFMAGIKLLSDSLNIPRDKLFSNPLMLPNTLLEVKEWTSPEINASKGLIKNSNKFFFKLKKVYIITLLLLLSFL